MFSAARSRPQIFLLLRNLATRTPISLVIISDYEALATRAVTLVVNRYYDPTTDQFLSIDPDVAQTDEPYVFTNDDPLNLADPWGLFASGGNGQSAFVTQTASKKVTETTIVETGGSKPPKVTISTSVAVVPLAPGLTLTISANATISERGSQSTPSLNIGSNGSVGLTADGTTVSALNGGPAADYGVDVDIPHGSSSMSFSVGNDEVTTSISAAISYEPEGGIGFSPQRGLDADVGAAAVLGGFIWVILKNVVKAPDPA